MGSTLPVLLVTPVLAHPGSAIIISNGTAQMGVWDEGRLNVPGGVASPEGTLTTGLRFVPTGNEATGAGCLCESWGVGEIISSVAGYANEATDGVVNLAVESFVSDGDSATSLTLVKDVADVNVMRVTHDYQPAAAAANL